MARSDTIDIAFRAELADYQKKIRTIPGITTPEIKKMEKAWKDGQKVAEKSAEGITKAFEKSSKDVKKVAEVFGGQFGAVADTIEKLGGAAGTGLAPVALLSAGVLALGASAVAVVSATADAARNVETLTASMTLAEKEAYEPNIRALTELKLALEALDAQSAITKVALTGDLAPAVMTLTDSWTGLLVVLTRILDSFDGIAAYGPSLEKLAPFIPGGGVLTTVSNLAEVGRDAAQERAWASLGADGMTGGIRRPAGYDDGITPPESLRPSVGVTASKANLDAARKELEAFKAWAREFEVAQNTNFESIRAAQAAAQANLASLVNDLAVPEFATMQERHDLEINAIYERYNAEIEKIKEYEKIAEDAELAKSGRFLAEMKRNKALEATAERQMLEVRASRISAANDSVNLIAGFSDSLLSIASTSAAFLEREIESYRDSSGRLSKEGRAKALELFNAQKAIALSQVAISTAVASMQALASAPNYIVGLVMAGLTTAAGIAQGALIASEQPSFHVGGMIGSRGTAPDEVGINALQGESVLNRRATAMLGERGVDALNSGASMPASGPLVIANVYRHRTLDTVLGATLRRAGSPLSRAMRDGRDLAGWRK